MKINALYVLLCIHPPDVFQPHEEGIPILGSFPGKNQRALKLSMPTGLNMIVTNNSNSLKPPMIDAVLKNLPALIEESNMHISQVAVLLLTCMAKVCPSSLSKIGNTALPGVLHLVHSPVAPMRVSLRHTHSLRNYSYSALKVDSWKHVILKGL
ncbi:cullin-associated NEDD8-dissociated protein 1-like isoform 1-T2 [Salvelinus alpinus]